MKRPSAPLVISVVALFFSLTAAGIAASPYIITSTHQIKPNVLRALRGERGPRGGPGQAGAQGPAGAAGTFATTDITVAAGVLQPLCAFGGGSCGIATSTAVCPGGSVAIGGGWQGDVVDGVPAVDEGIGSNEWTVTMDNNAAVSGEFQATVECAS
jgi:hypothetical protein